NPGEMFEAKAALGELDVQLVYYRGYDECKAGRWITSASELHRVMRHVSCCGGETQIERVLSHAIRRTGNRKVSVAKSRVSSSHSFYLSATPDGVLFLAPGSATGRSRSANGTYDHAGRPDPQTGLYWLWRLQLGKVGWRQRQCQA